MGQLFEGISFDENPLYETIIQELVSRKYAIVENFFTADEVLLLRNALLQKYDDDKFKKAAIGNRTNEIIEKSIRGDFILWMDESNAGNAESLFFQKINDLTAYLNRTCFLGILHKEFHYALYPQGTYYKRHLDTFQNDDRRKLSFVCYLNEAGWLPENGGELVLFLDENGKEEEKSICPLPGRVVIFESQIIEHEVRPVNKERLSITGWLKTR
ncbi:MAG TPA: 2OG-Fe(II) oxygenase [Aquaticitalea sp.]|nr:2OG-Fe(II) oxygenase [Aquaticitalea sp.]HNU58610.1 2OG-Fe(II) oxygenase [Aquaticitalea sp.]